MTTINNVAGLSRIADGWSELAASSAHLPTQDAAWAIACAEAFGQPHVVTIGDPDAPDAIAPLTRAGATLQLSGLAQLYEPTDLLARSDEARNALVEQLVRTGRTVLELGRIPAGSPTVAALRRAMGRRGVVRMHEMIGHPALELSEVWQEPGGGLSSSRRSALRRARRHAEQSGEVTTDLIVPTPEQVGALLDEAFDVEARSWKGRAGTALVQVPEQARFYRCYAAAAAARGTLRVELLRIDGRAVAMQIALEWRRRIWLLKIGYDEGQAAASPGQLLLGESIADAARRGLEGYELMGSPAAWTDVWAPDLRPCVRMVAYPLGVRGGVAFGTTVVRAGTAQARSRTKDALRALLRRAERKAARHYVAGPALADALREERRYAAAGYATTVGYWHSARDAAAAKVREECSVAVEQLPSGSELSIKPPGLGNDARAIAALLERARERGIGLHFDALQPKTAAPVLKLAAQLAPQADGVLGCTLPGRWERSVADASLAIEHKLRVRIVKSEWADPQDPDRDPRAGYLEVVDALAGRASYVEVATQDAELASAALDSLRAAGTPCELQVLYGMRSRRAIAVARERDVPVRVYVPYGTGRLPFDLDALHRHPAKLMRLLAVLAPFVPHGGPPL